MEKILNYRKPTELCFDTTEWKYYDNVEMFINYHLDVIKNLLNADGLIFRLAKNDDIIKLEEFIQYRYACFTPEIAEEISKYDLYRFINFGHGLLIENSDNKILACLFEAGYDTTDRMSYTLRLGVDDVLKGRNIGKLLIEYSSLLAMKRGSKTKRGLLDLTNFSSTVILVNKIGWMCDGFYPELTGLGTCFNIVFPLSIEGFISNRIDPKKLELFLKSAKHEIDYKIIPYYDIDRISEMYLQKEFRIVYLLRGGFHTDRNSFLALPYDALNIVSC
jgi:hypothetical protein